MKDTYVDFDSKRANPGNPQVFDIISEELCKKLEQVCIVDVRSLSEFSGELGHIPGAQLNVLDTLEAHLHELPKDKCVIFVCRSGARSARAALMAALAGLKNVYNLKGGMLRWNELGLNVEGQNSDH